MIILGFKQRLEEGKERRGTVNDVTVYIYGKNGGTRAVRN